MKPCPNCKAVVEDNFDVCWNCNYSFEEKKVVEFKDLALTGSKDLKCLRCKSEMVYSGEFKFHEGARTGVLGVIGEMIVNREAFDLYLCPECGKVELFSPNI